MALNWLVPITQENPITFGAMRFPINGPEAPDFLRKLSSVHPRCLMSFKAELLLSDDSDEACGGSDFIISWSGQQDITIEGDLVLSHCAEAFMDYIPNPTEILLYLESINTTGWDKIQLKWLRQMRQWLTTGYRVIMMREA